MSTVIEGILMIHKKRKVTYTLNTETDKVFEKILDKLNDQFNLKYTIVLQISVLQPDLNNNEKSEKSVFTKVTEPIHLYTLPIHLWLNPLNILLRYLLQRVFYE